MRDYSNFKAPFIKPEEIRKRADDFRLKYTNNKTPVDIEDIVEFGLKISIMPKNGLCDIAKVDAAISSDCKIIHVDYQRYMNNRFLRRVRYSIAHEVGHLELHSDIIPDIRPTTPEEWKNMVLTMPSDEYGWCEYHAYEFAGRLLVPKDDLSNKVNAKKRDLLRLYDAGYPSEVLFKRFSDSLVGDYEVSTDVISRRLIYEELWPFPIDRSKLRSFS
jgi:Zn-dependent peptidase ImmA (M78 family)